MRNAMSQCVEEMNFGAEIGLDCEKALRRDFQKRLAITFLGLTLGLVSVLSHVA
ncbi:MAG TPA: hypothetical protein VGD59_11510 [Acidisarcina sp.]